MVHAMVTVCPSIPFATRLGLIVQHHKRECPVEKLDYCIQGQGHSEDSVVSECFSGWYIWITEHFVTKLGMVMQHHEPECQAERKKKMFAIFKVKVTARAHMIKIWLFFPELFISWQPNLVWWYIIISQSVLWKKGWLHSGSRSQQRVKILMFVQMS